MNKTMNKATPQKSPTSNHIYINKLLIRHKTVPQYNFTPVIRSDNVKKTA